MPSCAAWLSWKCQIAPGTAREHVRVARALPDLPLIRAEFAAARLSYAKVRALTRIADADNEADLAQMALPMTAGQLERFARAHRRVTDADGARARSRRQLRWGWVDDHGSPSAASSRPSRPPSSCRRSGPPWTTSTTRPTTATRRRSRGNAGGGARPPRRAGRDRLGPAAAAAAAQGGHREPRRRPCRDLRRLPRRARRPGRQPRHVPRHHPRRNSRHHRTAGARRRSRGNAEGARRPGRDRPAADVPESHPAWPGRCHLEDGDAISPATLQMIACNATLSAMLHDADGSILNVGRRTRKLSAALRRAVRERDRHRCRYPGCESRRVDAHHIRYWSNGGQTKLGQPHLALQSASSPRPRQGHRHRRRQRRVRVLPPRRRAAPEQPAAPGRRPRRHHRHATEPRSPPPPSSPRTPAAASTSTWPSGSPSPTPRSAPNDASRQRKPPRPRPPEPFRRGWSSCAAGPSGGRRAPRPGRGPRPPSARWRRPRTRPGRRRR